jgi:hypothetical protein
MYLPSDSVLSANLIAAVVVVVIVVVVVVVAPLVFVVVVVVVVVVDDILHMYFDGREEVLGYSSTFHHIYIDCDRFTICWLRQHCELFAPFGQSY